MYTCTKCANIYVEKVEGHQVVFFGVYEAEWTSVSFCVRRSVIK